MSTPDRLILVCTDHGTHPARRLAQFYFTPDMGEGYTVWDANSDHSRYRAEPIGETGRQTRAGQARTRRSRTEIQTRTRSDGGTTYVLPPCPTCQRPNDNGRELRDDTLARILRTWPDMRPVDVSLIP